MSLTAFHRGSRRFSSRSRILFLLLLIGIVIIGHFFADPLKTSTHLSRVSSSILRYTSDKEDISSPEDEAYTIPYSTATPTDRLIANTTLGFEKIFVLGLPDRLAKRDGMELAASVTSLNLTWMDGVLGGEMHPNSIPPYHNDPHAGFFKTDGELGCWRGHMNIIHRIVKEKISSALIMEDDADWDIHIVQQMQKFASVSREFLKEDPDGTWRRKKHQKVKTGSPYGEGWDVLWIGHCGGWPPVDGSNHIAVVHNDSTVPPVQYINAMMFGIKNTTKLPSGCSAHKGRDPEGVVCDQPRLASTDRLVQERTSPLCTTGYAISLQGARKYLARIGGLSLTDVTAPIDWEMIEMCRQNGKNGTVREASRCLTVSPPYIGSHRAKGSMKGDSDIEGHGGGNGTRAVGTSGGLVYPSRMNVENLIGGYEPESQYIQEANGKWRFRKAEEYRSLP
jgi:GR25 family glycosyltransferase involved in LPS biosynthesis